MESKSQRMKSKSYSCYRCGKRFVTYDYLNLHERSRCDGFLYQCPQCPNKFYQYRFYKKHVRKYRGGVRPYKCSKCEKSFTCKINWTQHEISHSKYPDPITGPYFCPSCGVIFKTSLDFNNHTHPSTCLICDKRFATQQALKVHMSNNHGDARPQECDIRKKRAKLDYFLQREEKESQKNPEKTEPPVEFPFRCKFCGLSFITQEHLNWHEFAHTGRYNPHTQSYREGDQTRDKYGNYLSSGCDASSSEVNGKRSGEAQTTAANGTSTRRSI